MTTPIRFMHFSDTHFGVENYGKLDPSSGLSTRLIDFRKSMTFSIEAALAAGIELAVFTGDAYKSRDPSQTHQREFARCLSRLTAAGIPVVLLTGNHDISNARGRANSIEIFGELAAHLLTVVDKPGVRTVTTSKGRAVQIAAIPYLSKSNVLSSDQNAANGVQDTTAAIVARYEEAIDHFAVTCSKKPELPTIFLGHFSVSSARVSALQKSYLTNEPEVSKSALIRKEFDYVALGHIHKYQNLNAGYQPPVIYSGSIDRIDFGERNEAKGFVLVDMVKGHVDYKFIEAPVRPFLDIEIDARRSEHPTDHIVEALSKEDLDEAVVKVTYHIKPEDESLIDERRIHAALSGAFIKVAVRKEVEAAEKVRRGMDTADALSPLDALGKYLDRHPEYAKKRDELTAKAEALVKELNEEEMS